MPNIDHEIISQYLYDKYTKEYSGKKEWDRPKYLKWLEKQLFNAQITIENEKLS